MKPSPIKKNPLKKHKTSKQWMHEHVNDLFVQLAKREGYRAAAAYKLLEIDARDRLLKPGMVVVDLGATPGGWSQVAAAKVGRGGEVVAPDLLPLDPLAGGGFLPGGFRRGAACVRGLEDCCEGKPVGLVISDMAPNICGVASADQARALHLAELAMEFALEHLKPAGSFLCKVFQEQ